MEQIELLRRCVAGFTMRATGVSDQQWAATTPCPDWTVRSLVNHIVYEQRWAVPLLRGATIDEVGGQFDGDLLGGDPLGVVRDAGMQIEAAFAVPGALDSEVHLSFGDTPSTEYLHQLAADHLIHSWDLAAALGADRGLDPAAVQACADWFAERESAYRQAGAIGPRATVPDGASDQDRLLAAFGRDPRWAAPVV